MFTPQRYRQLLDEHGFSHAIMTAQQMGLARAIFEEGRASGAAESERDRVRLMRIEAAALNLVAQRGRHNTEIAYKRLEEALS